MYTAISLGAASQKNRKISQTFFFFSSIRDLSEEVFIVFSSQNHRGMGAIMVRYLLNLKRERTEFPSMFAVL